MRQKSLILLYFFVFFAFAPGLDAGAQDLPVPAPPVIGAKSYLVIDASTGFELATLNPDERLAPASLTKLMSAYVVFTALKEGRIRLEDEVTVSEKAWRTEGSRMFIEVGKQVPVQDLLLGMIVQSGNDASVALAEYVGGTESVFAEMMNQRAAALGMSSSHFMNATGLPDDMHYSTARDIALVAKAIIAEFPDYYRWYSVREYEYNGITQKNRNSLLWRDPSVDGVKTGSTDDAGYCLVSSAMRDGMRVIAVVLGTASAKARIDGSQALLNYGFRFYETRLLYRAGEKVADARIWKSERETTPLGVSSDLYITVPRGRFDEVESVLNMPAVLVAPVAQGQPLAELQVSLNGETLVREPLRALEENPNGSLWQRTVDGVQLWLE
ncbi:MAG: D-alanyl-D-alanine carboxypeptidase [Gammaproteobacteria bacterium]|nr:D-alanyl-D-alanine carboxypeptidase [Gammaproteobacteria bacterium]MDH4254429.1 D-alanyl-D-alanine carboxypeptidase [Gammaproteobacteria bacterium]MDH5311090.1 D-alanyl-D-alanine carboxypeptidase [Gammaproteobacteria bacterium]